MFSAVYVIKSIRRVLAFLLFTESTVFLGTIESIIGKFSFKTVKVQVFCSWPVDWLVMVGTSQNCIRLKSVLALVHNTCFGAVLCSLHPISHIFVYH